MTREYALGTLIYTAAHYRFVSTVLVHGHFHSSSKRALKLVGYSKIIGLLCQGKSSDRLRVR